MGDRDDRALVLLEMALEPGDRLGVEMVGRLVEQQQVGRLQQQAAEGDATAFAARELGHVGVGGRQAQSVHRRLQHRLQVPGVGGVDLVLEPGELVGGLVGVVRRDLVVAVDEVAQFAHTVLDVALDVLGLVELRLLLEHSDGGVRMQRRFAAVLGVDAGHDPQQRRLAGAVVAEDADLRAGKEAQGDVIEHLLVGRMGARDLVHGEDVLGGHEAGQDSCGLEGS